ncbi:MAG: 16S rRNA (uracil(1498)-N(3))-methyltransferase [Clostridia bacterium]|nr:16S rRNA (uracil(1498)-N(3))-methyltransferase [Clostridia bacterium]
MPRFFLPEAPLEGETCVISGEDANHISRSLRMRVGERIVVAGGGYESETEIVRITSGEVYAVSLSRERCKSEPPFRYRLFQCLPKGDKFDEIIRKSVETGVCEITPVISSRVISRPEGGAAAVKAARWNRISENAAMQCGRGAVPKVGLPVTFEGALADMRGGTAFFCWENGGTPLPELLRELKPADRTVSFFVGAEGGISEGEADALRANGAAPVTLGRRILRCETCAPFVLACLSYAFEM